MTDYLELALRQRTEEQNRGETADVLFPLFHNLRTFVRKRMKEKQRKKEKQEEWTAWEKRVGRPVSPDPEGDKAGERARKPASVRMGEMGYSVTPVLRERLTPFSEDGAALWREEEKGPVVRDSRAIHASDPEAERLIRGNMLFDRRLFSDGRNTELLEQWRLTRQRAAMVQDLRRNGTSALSVRESREKAVPVDPEYFDRAVERDARRYDGAFVLY